MTSSAKAAGRFGKQDLPVIGVVDAGSADAAAGAMAAFRKGLGETGYVEGQNVTVEYHWCPGPTNAHGRARDGVLDILERDGRARKPAVQLTAVEPSAANS
jgi:hypothetical protein